MGYNLKAYFTGKDSHNDCVQYSVNFVPRIQQHWPWVEVELAGKSPFILEYETSNTPFEPIRKSRASISVVANDYFFDLYGEDAQHTIVTLVNENTQQTEWVGFLTNNLMNQPQDGCLETFTLEAMDCVSSLEYFDYHCINDKKQIVDFQSILAELMQQCLNINNLYVDSTMQNESGQTIRMDELFISEQNFFSSDTDEPWKMIDVLEEICRFCGYVCVQWKNDVYLFDPQGHAPFEWPMDVDTLSAYPCQVSSGDFSTYIEDTPFKFFNCTLHEDDVMGTGADISLETIYNTVSVQDSFYELDDFLPPYDDDDHLENIDGELWQCDKVGDIDYIPITPYYVSGQNAKKADASSSAVSYYQRQLEHDKYHPIYRAKNSLAELPKPDFEFVVKTDSWYRSIIDPSDEGYQMGIYVTNTSEAPLDVEVTINLSSWTETTVETFDVKERRIMKAQVHIPQSYWHDLDYITATYSINGYGPYSLMDICGLSRTHNYVCGSIVDTATVQKGIIGSYNYEVASKLDFDRYILISQCDEPNMLYNNPRSSAMTIQEKNYYFPSVFGLDSGFTQPIIIDDNCYITINASAIYERYKDMDFINPDWTSDCTGLANYYNCTYWGIFTGYLSIQTVCPALVFKLKCGGYWWDGSGWTTTEQPFYVDLHTPIDEDGYVDFSQWWNKQLDVINNMSWTEYSGGEGYKIPLTGVTFDWNKDIEFYICLPAKIQQYTGNRTHNGMNSYCWIKDFSTKLVTKGAENTDLTDVVYKNVINEDSLNELSDITLKITTYPNEGQHSYSNVGYNGKLIDKVIKLGLDGEANKMEENIVKEYVNQYSSNTISQNMVLNLKATPISRIKDTHLNKFFHVCGQEIDYAEGTQRVNMIESKIYNTNL